MNIIELVENYVKEKCKEYINISTDKYDFWNEHIKYVYEESKKLATIYNADIEIVLLGALLHDIALIESVGDRKEHHTNGKILANKILDSFNYEKEKKEKVLNCILNHRSSKNGNTIEEICVADADILAHFDNIPMLFNLAYNKKKLTLSEVRTWMKEMFKKDYDDLSDKTKEIFKEEYKKIYDIIIKGEGNNYV